MREDGTGEGRLIPTARSRHLLPLTSTATRRYLAPRDPVRYDGIDSPVVAGI